MKRFVSVAGIAMCFLCGVLMARTAGATGGQPLVNCTVELDRAVLPADETLKAVLKVSLDAPKPPAEAARPPVNLSIVLDRSGSMTGDKIEKAKQAAIEAVRRLGPRDVFSLVVYNHAVETVVPPQSAANVGWIEKRIRRIKASGNTALFGGVSQAAAEVRKHLEEQYVHRIILLSDGLANVGPSSPDDLGRLGKALVKEGISVTTIGVGTDYNEDLMAQLAQKSDGNTYFAETGGDLSRIFGYELGDVLSVVAQKVNVVIECPEGVDPVTIIGREGRIKGRSVELYLNQLYGGQNKYALVEVNIPAGAEGEKRDVATARVSYDNPFTQRSEKVETGLSATFSRSKDLIAANENPNVYRDSQVLFNAEAQNDAIELADKGEKDKAVNVLRSSARALRHYAKKLNDKDLEKKANEVDAQAAQMEVQGMTKGQRKYLRADAYQDITQQYGK